MTPLLADWKSIQDLIRAAYVVLFLDYDGTLAPIAARPEIAKILSSNKKRLKALSNLKDIKIIIISGRSLKDVQNQVGLPRITYAGNHGFELEGPQVRRVLPSVLKFKRIATKIETRLRLAYTSLPQILIENKLFTLSIHYRGLPQDSVRLAKRVLLKEIGTYLKRSQATLSEGKKVWEIRPPILWDKGRTVLWFLKRLNTPKRKGVVPIYIGDDLTDESAFKALRRIGITVKVTDAPPAGRTNAQYFLSSPKDVSEFLKRLHELKEIRIPGKARYEK